MKKNSYLIKNLNRKIILEEILKNKEISRASIAKNTGLNKVTVSAKVESLFEEKLLNEKKGDKANGKPGGKKPMLLSLDGKAGYSIGLDLLTGAIKIIVTDLNGEIVLRNEISINTPTPRELIDLISINIEKIKGQLPSSYYGIIGLTIGVHGHVNNENIIVYCDNLKFTNVDIKSSLQESLNIPVTIMGTHKLGIVAEKSVYNMKKKSVVYLNMSNGIGASIVVDNVIIDGKDGLGGELGHMIIDINGNQCHCGNRGCWETYACENAFLRDLAMVKKKEHLSIEDYMNFIENKDSYTISAAEEHLKYINIGMSNILSILNPDVIILHNRIIEKFPVMLEELKELISYKGDTEIKFSEYKDDGGCIGGCYLNILNFLQIEEMIKRDQS